MFSPHVGRVTSEYGNRSGGFHAGMDIAPPVAGTVGTPVYAAFAGTVQKVVSSRKPGQSASSGPVLAPGRSGNGLLIRNPDGERQLYGHVRPIVKAGAKVSAGQVIGYTDRSGRQTGPHLHFEVWNKAGRTRNPRVDFAAFGLTPGRAGGTTGGGTGGGSGSDRTTLKRGMSGEDVKELQRALNKWKATPDNRWPGGNLLVDGDYGAFTEARVRDWQTRNHGGAYPRKNIIDGVAGPVTLRALGLA